MTSFNNSNVEKRKRFGSLTESQDFELALHQEPSDILQCINKIFGETIRCETIEQFALACLEVVEQITGSRTGFVVEVMDDGSLTNPVISDPAWKTDQVTKYSENGFLRSGYVINGIYGQILERGESLIINDPAAYPESYFLWEEHPELESFLGVPLVQEDRTIGIIAVGNRAGGYREQDRDALEKLAPSIVETLSHKRMEERIRKESLEIELANQILNIFLEQTGHVAFDRALEVILTHLESQHGIFGYIDESEDLVCPTLSKMFAACEVENKCIHYPQDQWKGNWGRALRQRRTIISNEEVRVPAGHVPIRNNLAAPIIFQRKVIGLLNIANKEGGYSQENQALLEGVAERIAPIMYAWVQRQLRSDEQAQAEGSLRRSEARFKLLADTAGYLLASENPQNIVNVLCQEVMVHLDCHFFLNYLCEDPERLRLNAWSGISDERAKDIEWLGYGDEICGCVAREQERIIIEDIQNSCDPSIHHIIPFGIQAYCCYPLMAQGKLIGTLSFATRSRTQFSEEDIELMRTVTDQVAIAMQRIETMNQLEQRVQERTAELQLRADQLSRMASELTLAEQRERRRLAQVLHDHLQQLLVGAKFGLALLTRRIGQEESIEEIQDLINEAINASRSLTVELSPPILHEAGLEAGLEWLARWMKEKHGLEVQLFSDGKAYTDREDVLILVFQAVRELLFNVVKHAQVTVSEIHLAVHDEHNLRVTISDSGVGFDPETMGTMEVHGGFGLFSIRERLALLGGDLEIKSAIGKGSKFTIIAPMQQIDTESENQENYEFGVDSKTTTEELAKVSELSRTGVIRLLLADDHQVLRQGLVSLLSEEDDLEVVAEASDGLEALQQARIVNPDVVLMDFSMPRMDGVEATRRIKEEMPQIKIIGLSMYEEPDRSTAMIEAGASAYLTKSGNYDVLIESIREIHSSPEIERRSVSSNRLWSDIVD